jgi:hypothetical protein
MEEKSNQNELKELKEKFENRIRLSQEDKNKIKSLVARILLF